ncbi:MAG: serine/threonine protein kinase, partial [Acidobacteria bacterium]|nr:serine/threonine protein kinase [Acidobacteriota bacterium]
GEVRTARKVTHKNVCRIFDIGEFEGTHFLSMEFIDGEDLSSLLRRIGRLPHDKAVDVARQVCAGLVAAHDAGVLHRDLKPANVMIDGRGDARITDFGLAGLEADIAAERGIAGTPAYMSPEQMAGTGVSIRSDIYSLGLLLYEVFTGRRAFAANTFDELRRLHQSSAPESPSNLVRELDPAVEKVILRCLEKDPARRPVSALHVAALLPGGDPLAAAMAAGDTPSPETVAAAHKEGVLTPAMAWGGAASGALLLVFLMFAGMKVLSHNRVPFQKPPEVLSEKANQILEELGYREIPADSQKGFLYDFAYVGFLAGKPASAEWDRITSGQPAVVAFRERHSPKLLEMVLAGSGDWRLEPQMESGQRTVVLDTRGRLIEFSAVPEERIPGVSSPPAPDYAAAFRAAGLDPANFKEAVPEWAPPHGSDTRSAWVGVLPDHPDVPLRVETAAHAGKIVFFRLIFPWTKPDAGSTGGVTARDWVASTILMLLVLAVLFTAVFLAARNIRSGSGDRKGAFKTGLAVFLLLLAGIFLGMHHVAGYSEVDRLFHVLRESSYRALTIWVTYLALEPIVRRNMPDLIVSWNRLLAGEWRDSLVGRDVLLGSLAGLAHASLIWLGGLANQLVYGWKGVSVMSSNESLGGTRAVIASMLTRAGYGIGQGLLFVCFLAILSLVLRRRSYAAAGFFVIFSLIEMLFFARSPAYVVVTLMVSVLFCFLVSRAGLLATLLQQVVFSWVVNTVFTTKLSAWYANGMYVVTFLILSLLAYGAYSAMEKHVPGAKQRSAA